MSNFNVYATEQDDSCEYTSCADCNCITFGDSVLDECGNFDNSSNLYQLSW